ncbi:MAG: hypothetical protein ACHQF3_07920 [Alphaproteobacteria bacterium]
MSTSRIKLIGAMLVVSLLSFAAGTVAQERYGEMNNAEGALHNAVGFLQHARHDFGGHRSAAVRLSEDAIREVRIGRDRAAAHGM